MSSENKAGRYQLLDEIGRGAMGVVWKGYDPTIGRTVAVKTMKLTEEATGLPRPDLVMRFQTETRAAGLLTHPNIVVIYDAGEDEGIFFITMEYIQGVSLQTMLDKKQAFPISRVIKLMEQACAGLGYAHQHNVVHRDVKPANLMLNPDDTVKITDFGMAKILQLGTTQTGQIVGTPSYMSPEQVKGKAVDGRSDIFSLGVVLYELVTGEKPFPGQNVTTVIYKIVNEDPIPPLELDSSIHPGLNQVINKALEKEPDDRYQSCQEMFEDLRRYRDLGMRDLSKTVVVTGRSQSLAAPPPPPKPADKGSGTLTGVPMPDVPPVPPPKPAAPPAAVAPPPPAAPAHRSATSLPHLPYKPAEPQPEAKSGGHLWMGLVLVLLLAGGGYLLWPTLQQLWGGKAVDVIAPSQQPPAASEPAAAPEKQPEAAESAPAPDGTKAPEPKASEPVPAPAKVEAKPEPVLPKGDALALQRKVEQRLARAGFAGKVRVEVDGNTVKLSGSLKAAEHRRLMQAVRAADSRMKVDDRIEVASAAGAGGEEKPRTAPGLGELEVLTDVMGATAVLKGPKPDQSWECKTPCRFEELPPGRYTMNVTHPSYRPINRIIAVTAGNIKEERLTFQPYASGIYVTSRPPQAEVFINGQKQSEPTPTTVRLAPGTYRIRVQKAGYEGTEQAIELKGDSLQQLNVQLAERPRGAGYVDVRTVPPGADILIDGTNTGRKTPFVLQLNAGRYTLTLFLKGYQPVRKDVVVEPNKTLSINQILPR